MMLDNCTVVQRLRYRFPSDHRSQAPLGLELLGMGDRHHLGKPSRWTKKCHRDGSGPSPAPDPNDAGSYPVTVAGTIPKWGNWSRRNPLKGLYSCVRTKERRVG